MPVTNCEKKTGPDQHEGRKQNAKSISNARKKAATNEKEARRVLGWIVLASACFSKYSRAPLDKNDNRTYTVDSQSIDQSVNSHKLKQPTTIMATLYQKEVTKVLIYGGKTGWIGGMMAKMLEEKGTNK